jgi:hypothetical protein
MMAIFLRCVRLDMDAKAGPEKAGIIESDPVN